MSKDRKYANMKCISNIKLQVHLMCNTVGDIQIKYNKMVFTLNLYVQSRKYIERDLLDTITLDLAKKIIKKMINRRHSLHNKPSGLEAVFLPCIIFNESLRSNSTKQH